VDNGGATARTLRIVPPIFVLADAALIRGIGRPLDDSQAFLQTNQSKAANRVNACNRDSPTVRLDPKATISHIHIPVHSEIIAENSQASR